MTHRRLNVLLAALVLASLARWWQGGVSRIAILAAMVTPVVLALSLIVTGWSWWRYRHGPAPRRRPLLATALTAIIVATTAPLADYFVSDRPQSTRQQLRLATLNTNTGRADRVSVLRVAHAADVLVLQELPPQQVAWYSARLGAAWRLAHSGTDQARNLKVALWIRATLSATNEQGIAIPAQPASRVDVGGTNPLRVVGLRLVNPWFQDPQLWRDGFTALRFQAKLATQQQRALVIIGDLNAAPSSIAFSQFLQQAQLRNCAALTGRWRAGTWGPRAGSAITPVMIDHLLLNSAATCQQLRAIAIPGSDHRALTATVGW